MVELFWEKIRKYKVLIPVCLVLLCISGCSEAGKDLNAAVFDGHTEGAEPEYVEFGEYPKGKPIEWIVLDEKDGAKLLFSRYSLFFTAYNHANENVTWETSDLRAEMNGWFYNEAFSGAEKKQIQTVTLTNDDSPGGTDGGNDTKDKVFALSLTEVHRYFDLIDPDTGKNVLNENNGEVVINGAALKTVCLEDTRPQYFYEGDVVPSAVEAPDSFYLRTPGFYQRAVYQVRPDGGCTGSESAIVEHSARPAIWVK